MKFTNHIWAWIGLGVTVFSCTSDATHQDAEGGQATFAEFEEKTPKLPTAFVDTSGKNYPWMKLYSLVQSISERIDVPSGYKRVTTEDGSFGRWLRMMPLHPGRPSVHLYDGSPKSRQDVHHLVINMDVGTSDLQQCADAVMRVRAEYLFATKKDDQITFNFTNGTPCPWSKWMAGQRPVINGNSVTWKGGGTAGRSYTNFKSYLQKVFMYAGTSSLSKELKAVADPIQVEIGDVFIQGGFPGHAVIVMDVAENKETGSRIFLLAQSYMPAQEMHILKNFNDEKLSPWYEAKASGALETPEWTFNYAKDLKRF